jgi:hypothetical protein
MVNAMVDEPETSAEPRGPAFRPLELTGRPSNPPTTGEASSGTHSVPKPP